jgi:hypothetical protein
MKAKLEYTLPEEEFEYYNAVNGTKMYSIIHELDQWLRTQIKYQELSENQYEAYESCRDHLRELIYGEGINLDL